MASKYIRSVTKILKATSGRLFGRVTSGTGLAEELTPSDVRTLLSVSTTAEVAAAYQPIGSYAAAVHTHTIVDVTGLQAALDGKQAVGSYAASVHTHSISDVTNLQSSLDGKQATLVSGTSLKTINSTSLLGSGDIVVSASPGGSSGQVQFNNAGAFGGAAAVTYATAGTHVTVTAQSASAVPLQVRGAASQSGNLLEARNSSNALLSMMSAAGWMSVGNGSAPAYALDVGGQIRCTSQIIMGGSINALERASLDGDTSIIVGQYDSAVILRGHFPSRVWAKFKNNEAYFGNGEAQSTTFNYRLQATSGSGTNNGASTLTLAPGRSTGSATPASVIIQRTVAGASGTTSQTLSDAVQIDGNTASGETPLLLLDIGKGTLQRVSIGASDSGGTGFKVLRVPN